MKLIKTSKGNHIKISKSEWEEIGEDTGWMETSPSFLGEDDTLPLPMKITVKKRDGQADLSISEGGIERSVGITPEQEKQLSAFIHSLGM